MADKPQKLYLIDGANYFFRAFYAIRNLSNSKGFPTGALYGFAQMLLKLLREEKPDLVAVCFDTPEPTFRDEMYKEYKANRKAPPEEIVQQFPFMRPIAEVLGLPIIDKPGFEADDLIGTLAKEYAAKGCEVVVVSGDKDLMQLVGPNISILDEMKGLRIGPKQVEDRFGVGPDKVVEVLGLSGDASDNVPGISGVGPKTATVLIQKYGTVENAIAHADEVGGSLGDKLKKQAAQARLSLELVKIDTGVKIEMSESDLRLRKPDDKRMRELFGEFEFTKLLGELSPVGSIARDGYRLVENRKALDDVLAKAGKTGAFSFVLEMSLPNPMRADVIGFALAWGQGEAAYIPVGHVSGVSEKKGETADLFGGSSLIKGQVGLGEVVEAMRKILADVSIRKIGHDLNGALLMLRRMGVAVEGIAIDTMIASYLLDPSRDHGIDALAQRFLSQSMVRLEDVIGKGRDEIGIAEAEPASARDYVCERADVALRLAAKFGGEIEKEGLSGLLHDMEMPLLEVLVDMQFSGVRVDSRKLAALADDFSKRIGALEKIIHDLAGEPFNINSPRQLGDILFGKMKLPGARKTKTGFSTNQEILEELASKNELARLVIDYRSLSKLKGTYVDALQLLVDPETGRIHTSFNQAVTATGRLSSSDPNLQNIPNRGDEGRKIREAFVAENGFVLLSADYSQIELRVLAHMSGDATLTEAFKKSEDVHAITASGIFGVKPKDVTSEQRAVGKTVNFATIYGQTAYGLSRQLGIDVGEANEYIDNYFKKYPGVAKYRDEVIGRAKKEGMVETLFGRRRFVPDITSTNGQLAQFAERAAFNTVFQGTAADIIKRAMISIHAGLPKISKRARMILQVHDELLFEAPKDEVEGVKEFAIKEMVSAAQLKVPLEVAAGTGPTWSDAH
ncbi:MAG: DNA polymerase I [Pseudomonadota bacterium]